MPAQRPGWEQLGVDLESARVELDPRYANLSLFAEERGIDYRLAWDIEHGRRTNYRRPTLRAIEVAYGLETAAIDTYLRDGGRLQVRPPGDGGQQGGIIDRPDPPREAVLIRLAREAAGMTAPEAAKEAAISAARWSQIEDGYEIRRGRAYPVRGQDDEIAPMAAATGLAPHRLDQAGRAGAADVLREILRRRAEVAGIPAGISLDGLTPAQIRLVEGVVAEMRGSGEDEGERREANGA
jgi:hypothetical protein